MDDNGRQARAQEGLSDRKLVGQLLAVLAHDFRNPLAALCSNLDYLKTVTEKPGRLDVGDSTEAIDDGIVSCDGLAHLIQNMELLGQTLREEVGVPSSPVRLGMVAMAAVESCKAAARSHGLSLKLDPATHHSGIRVEVPRVVAVRAVANLIRNSIQHAPTSTTVEVSLREEAGHGVVVVRDGGLALSGDGLNAFSPRGQVPSARTHAEERYSRGLGLMCAQLGAKACGAEATGGSGAEGGGNQFEMAFPKI